MGGWDCALHRWPDVAETVDFGHIKGHHYQSRLTINPTGVVPAGSALEL